MADIVGLSGRLQPNDATAALESTTKQQVDAGLATKAAATHASAHAAGGSDPVTPEAIGAVAQLFTSGRYYTTPSGTRTTGALANGTGAVAALPFWVGEPVTFDRIGANVTTAVAATTVLLGIYADNGHGSPGSLVVDAGTIDASTTGAKEITISQAVTPGLVWLVVAPLGGSPGFQSINSAAYYAGGLTLAGAAGAGGIYSGLMTAGGAVTSTLPGTFPSITTAVAFPPVVVLRAA